MTYRTADQVASEMIRAGQYLNISPKGIVIGLATELVESNCTVYANEAVPASMLLPHDDVGSDSYSVGPCQQQVVMGANGWWWSDAATCMDPTTSAKLFFSRLVKERIGTGPNAQDYNTNATTPGGWAQMVQDSKYPDRYDERMGDAQAIYDRLVNNLQIAPGATAVDATVPSTSPAPTPPVFNEDNQIGVYKNFSTRGGDTVDLLLIHTEEPYTTDYVSAQDLANVIKRSEGTSNPVSYHYSIGQRPDGTVDVIDLVDTDYECWAVLDSNPDSINYCFAGSSVDLATDEWMTRFGNAIDVCAYLVVQDARKYNVPLNFLFPLSTNTNIYPGPPPGISDHKYVTEYLGDGSHTDVGSNFPWAYFGQRINYYAGISTGGLFMSLTSDEEQEILQGVRRLASPGTGELTKLGPSRSFLATDGALIETMLGFDYNSDGNIWNVVNVFGYLTGEPSCVAIVEQVASGGPVPTSWAASVPAVAEFGQSFCKALVAFKVKLDALLNSVPATVAAVNAAPSTPSE